MPKRLKNENNHSAGISSNDPSDPPQGGLVQDVCRQWVVHEDAVLANQLQENEFERKYNRNLAERQLARQDVRLAHQVQNTYEERMQRVRQQRMRNTVEDDAIIAEQLQSEEIIRKEQERMISELNDEKMARRLQEKEKRRYELRAREKELRKQRKVLEAELKRDSSDLLENSLTPGVAGAAASASARERSPVVVDGATGNDLEFRIPSSGKLSEREHKQLQHLQDEELARHLQNQEQKHLSKMDKLKEIEMRDLELAKIMQEQEDLKLQKRRRSHRLRETRQSSDPCHSAEPCLLETRQSRSLPQSHELPARGNSPPKNNPIGDINPPPIDFPYRELDVGSSHPFRFSARPLPDTPSPELPRQCNMSLLKALERNADEEASQSHPMSVTTSCHPRDSRRAPLVLSDDEEILPPPLVSNAAKNPPPTNTNIFAAIDPTYNQSRQVQRVQDNRRPSCERILRTEVVGHEDGYCDLEEIRALNIVENNDGDDLEVVPGQRRQPFNRNANRASGHKSNCKQQ